MIDHASDDMLLRFVDETTGEVIEPAPAAPISTAALMSYAVTRAAADAARLQLAERMAALMREDPIACQLQAEIEKARATTLMIEAGLESAFSADVRQALGSGISLDIGFVRITWAKPADNWVMTNKLSVIAERNPELAKLLGIVNKPKRPSAPQITIRADRLSVVK